MDELERRRTWRALLLVTLLAAAARIAFAALTELPTADPWRHMSLVRNLRAGAGFTLFDGEPYLWYPPLWYRVAAVAPPEGVKWVAALFSTLAVPLFALYAARAFGRELGGWRAALAGGIALALCRPLVIHAGQLGAEGFALFLLAAALVASTWRRPAFAGGASGLLFGLAVVSRLQLGLLGFLFLPLLRHRRSALASLIAAALPLAALWLRNHAILSASPIVFTWDGVATRSASYGLLSTLAPQLHPTIVAANGELYFATFRWGPEWLAARHGLRWELLAFAGAGLACVVASRRLPLILAAAATVLFLGFLDATRSSWFERNWIGLLPVLGLGIAAVVAELWRPGAGARPRWLGTALLVATLAAAADSFRTERFPPVHVVVPPFDFLPEDRYLVAGGFYHPQGVIWQFPEKRFLGLPRDPELLDELLTRYPEYRTMLWHPFGTDLVQRELFDHVRLSPDYAFGERTVNAARYAYLLVHRR